MDIKSAGDSRLVSNRVTEKADLQNLNQRFATYIQAVRSAHDRENQQRMILLESKREGSLSDSLRLQYEQQIAELQAKLEDITKERNELEMNRVRYETTANEYENRIVSLNESVFEKQNELQRLHGALAAKDVELQEARADATQPRLALDSARLEVEDYRKRLEESERRLQLEANTKANIQEELSGIRSKMQQEILIYQQELSDMRNKLENSHQLILQLEDKVRKTGQTDTSLAEMMKKVREASEAELRRFMEETEAKYDLNIQEVKLRMDADVQNLAALAEGNARLQAQIDTQSADVRTLEAKLSIAENQRQSAENALENERSSFQSNVRNLERKLQETQDLLLLKIQELGAAQEANIPLRAEINALKALIEEEERRLNLETLSSGSPFVSALASRQQLSASPAFVETLGGETHKQQSESAVATPISPVGFSKKRLIGTSNSHHRETNASTTFPLGDGKRSRRPATVPVMSHNFGRSSSRTSNIPLATPTFLPTGSSGVIQRSSNEIENKLLSPSSGSSTSQLFDLKDGDGNLKGQPLGMDELPPRPDNPTPEHLPRRPLSATKTRYVPASEGQGKDYFDAMFNDLRKDTLYSKVTEDGASATASRVSSVNQDYINSTASATGNLKVLQISDDGNCVSVSNTSASQEESIGGFMLQQNVGGHPVAVFRFPPRARLSPATTTTVWSGKAVNGVHNPPFHYIWNQLDKWGTGPECTTILCKPNGQAVAWMTSSPRTVKIPRGYKYEPNVKQQTEQTQKLLEDMRVKNQQYEQGQSDSDEEVWKPDSIIPPSSYTSKPILFKDTGYDPRPIPTIRRPQSSPTASRTAISSGLLPSRTGSAPLHLHQPRPPATQVSGHNQAQSPYHPPWSLYYEEEEDAVNTALMTQSAQTGHSVSRDQLQSAPAGICSDHIGRKSPGQSARIHLPGTFWPPAEQHSRGMKWLRSQHNINFLPPMPKAFPCVTPVYQTLNKTY